MKKYIILTLPTALFACSNQTQKLNTEKPNVIVVFIDDEGYGDVGCYGATGFETPNLDQLARGGMRFTNFYSAQPVSSASRAGLLTGCYPNRIGFSGALFPHHKIGINTKEFTMAEMFKDQGYATACFGKWHLGWQKEFLPLQHGFDEYTGLPYSNDMWPNSNVTGERLPEGKGRGDYPELPLIAGNEIAERITSLKDQDKLTTLYTEKAVDFINRNAEKPFFLYLPHTMGHIPLGVSDKFRGKRIKMDVEEPELYNMMRDPGEQYNVIEYYPEKVIEIMTIVEKARKELGDLNVGIKKGSENREIGHINTFAN